jgi:hypothetical protein
VAGISFPPYTHRFMWHMAGSRVKKCSLLCMTCINQRYILFGVENYYIGSPLLIQYRELKNLMHRFLFYVRSDVTVTESLEKNVLKVN